MGESQTPMTRFPRVAAMTSVTMPAGLVIEMTHAWLASSAMRRAIASTTGTARAA
jgi:hypothetical protein